MLAFWGIHFSVFVCCFQSAMLLSQFGELDSPKHSIITHQDPDPIQGRAQLTRTLRSKFNNMIDLGGFASGGRAIMPDPCLTVEGFGSVNVKAACSYEQVDIKALSAFASQAGYGLGSETLMDLKVRNTLQIDASKISVSNQNWTSALRNLIEHIGTDMNFEHTNVEPKLYKLLIYGPGGHFKSHVDNEKHDGMFGTLMIELPSSYTGGELIVCHHGITKTFDSAALYDKPPYWAVSDDVQNLGRIQMRFLAHYADCKHEVKEVSTGWRLALIYSLCWKGEMFPAPQTTEQVSSDILHQLTTFDGCLGYILEYHYSIASLARYGVKALKGNDRKIYSFLKKVSLTLEGKAPDQTDKLTMYIVKASREDQDDGCSPEIGDPTITDLEDDTFAIDGSAPSADDMKILETFRTSTYEDVINNFDFDPEDSTVNDRWWRDARGYEPNYIGNEGGAPENLYTAFMLTFWREKWSKTIINGSQCSPVSGSGSDESDT